jgi:hypothetical protein
MKVNKKALQLIDKGLSSKTVSKLTESQIDTLHKKLFVEQTMVSKTDSATISKLKSEKKPFQVYEKELDEEDQFDQDVQNTNYGDTDQDEKQQGPGEYGNNPENDKKMDNNDVDGMGMMEEKDGPNPWAICHSQVGPKKSRKWERCVREVKKQLKEGKNPVSLFLETQIERIVEKHIPPRITKGDLLKVISESEPAVAPTKPTTKPGTKPTTKPSRPAHPGKNPNPGENPAPKAKKSETKENSPSPTTKPAPTKPGTKPDTRPRPAHPGKNPNPGENPAPKAKKVSPEDAKDKVIDVIMNLLEK